MNISASLLSCDFTEIGNAVRACEKCGAASIHLDITDGRYVENLTFGVKTVEDIKRITRLPVEVHLETYEPRYLADMFIRAGADAVIVQRDTCANPIHLLKRIRARGARAGVAIAPADDVRGICNLARHMDELVLMSVEPGFGGQSFEKSVYGKIACARELLDRENPCCLILADGGVNPKNAPLLLEKGADTLIVGSYIFSGGNIEERFGDFKL